MTRYLSRQSKRMCKFQAQSSRKAPIGKSQPRFSRRPDLRHLRAAVGHAAGLHCHKRRQKPAAVTERARLRQGILMARLDQVFDDEPRAAKAAEQLAPTMQK